MAKKKEYWEVSTPLMHNVHIHRLQSLLNERGYLEDEADSVYGVHTAQAVYRAKFWLGYLKPTQAAGPLLIKYLAREKSPTPAMKILAAKRRAAARRAKRKRNNLTKGQQVLRKACSQLGETEHPYGSNRSKYSIWYGLIGAWCAMFCTWCSVGIFKAFKRGSFVAYVPYLRAKALLGQDGLMVTTNPRSGNYVCYDWPPKDGTADHIGMYAEEADLRRFVPKAFDHALKEFGGLKKGEFWAVEGNTGIGNDSNGGMVMIRKRNLSNVQTFVKAS
jgi:hypothetical protein